MHDLSFVIWFKEWDYYGWEHAIVRGEVELSLIADVEDLVVLGGEVGAEDLGHVEFTI